MAYASVLNEDFADGTLETGVSLVGSPATPNGTVFLNGGSQGIDIDGILTQAILDDFELNIYGGGSGAPNYNTGVTYLGNMQESGVVDYALYTVKAATGDATYSLRKAGVGTTVYTEVASFGLASDLDAGVKGTLRHNAGTWSFFIDDVQIGSDYVGADDWVLSSNKMGFRLTSSTWEIDRIDFGTAGNAADTEAPVQQVAPTLDYGKHYPRVPMHFADAVTANVVYAAIILPHGSAVPDKDQIEAGTDASDVDVGTGRKDLATVASDTLEYMDLPEAGIARETIYAVARDTNDPPNKTLIFTIDKPALGAASEDSMATLIIDTTVGTAVSQSNGVAVFSLVDAAFAAIADSQLPGNIALLIHKAGNVRNFVGGSITDFDATGGSHEALVTAKLNNPDYLLEPGDTVKGFFTFPTFQATLADNAINAATLDDDVGPELTGGLATQSSLDAISTNGVPIAEGGVPGIYEGTVANNTAPSTAGFELSGGVEFDGQFVGSTIKLLSGNLAGTPLRITGSTASTNVITCVLRHNSGVLSAIPTVGAKYKIA